ncbi:regulator of MON1-CCZ1 complex-like [Macrosteles quadrilineatus]|uniref:regulator of MON1-CCZ1 complex-like n=1 Tax=Macrosteles quadrilineatus TaxID=74068 RepID=UPI0023E315D2|nr:regulator of MON1-CCZ1 complex-like [Macrosteles quadrilineatus]XP_054290589.1 regulator of MON1-CCZ1 complex-like [Macrosteles quadrilineatus]
MSIESYYLKLSEPLKFEAVSRARLNNVFFDECHNQVFSVQSGEMTEIIVRCPPSHVRSFKMKEKGPVISIKFNFSQNILAVQRTSSCVEFIHFQEGNQFVEFSHPCKSKNAKILGFVWMSASDIVYVTDQGVELCQVEATKCQVKMTKSLAMTVNWFLFCHHSSILLLSSGNLGNTVQPIFIKQGNLHKLPRFEVEMSGVPRSQKLVVEERDAVVGIVYGQPRVLVLRHQSTSNHQGAQVFIYTIKKMSTVKKTHILNLGRSGRFALSIVDNLIFVHHQASKTSLMFDIGLEAECDGSVYYHSPVMPPQPIRGENAELYSSNWIMFSPNVVIDAKIGCLWYLELELEHISKLVHSKSFLIEFFMLRANSKEYILRELREATQSLNQNLEELALVFDKLNAVYRQKLLQNVKWQLASPVSAVDSQVSESSLVTRVVIDQSDMYTNVLSKMADFINEDSPPRNRKLAMWVLLEYVRSLTDHQIPVQHYLHELVINSLILNKAYYQLHQLLQYFVVSDSKPLACLLLSLENLYPPAHQLALDMLHRLNTASQEITEVLLSKHQILPALRYAIESENEDQLSGRKFLELAQATEDKLVFYAVSTYFEAKRASVNGSVPSLR